MNLSAHRVALDDTQYPQKYDALLTVLEGYLNEIEMARDGNANLLARIQLCLVASVGLTQSLAANGFRINGLPAPAAPDDAVTKSYADGLSFAAALPAQAGNAGKEIITDGTTASWGSSAYGALAILNSIGYLSGR